MFFTFLCFLLVILLFKWPQAQREGLSSLLSAGRLGRTSPEKTHVSGELRYRSELWGCWRGFSVKESTTRMKLAVFVQKHTPNRLID